MRFSGAEPAGAINFAATGGAAKVQLEAGVVAQVGCTFVVLLVATRSVRLAIVCTLTLVCTLVAFYGILGHDPHFKLGLTEMLTGIFAVGYAIDYPMHIAAAYQAARVHGRQARAVEAVRTAGVAVLGSALSTICAMVAMQMCPAAIFRALGHLVCVLVGVSLLFTFGFLAPLLSLVGPDP